MPAITESTKRKLSLLQLAEELGNVSKACRIMGYHRDTFYEVRRALSGRRRRRPRGEETRSEGPASEPRGSGD